MTSSAGSARYAKLHQRSLQEREAYWAEQARLIDWERPFDSVCQMPEPPFAHWFAGGRTNLCHNAVDRHLAARGEQAALVWVSTEVDQSRSCSFAELHREVMSMAAILVDMGVGLGDRVLIYMPMVPEAVFAMLACARIGAIHSVVFGGFASASLATRIDDAQPRAIVTADAGSRGGKVVAYKPLLDEAIRLAAHKPHRVLVVDRGLAPAPLVEGRDLAYAEQRARHADADLPCTWVESAHPSYTLYTSGTTGKPKGVQRDTGGYAVALTASMRDIFMGRAGETFFCTSDIGWVVGHSYIVYGPLLAGMATILYEGLPVRPDAAVWWRLVEQHKVTAMFSAPTAVRVLRKHDEAAIKRHDVSSLRALFLAGEPLDEPTARWIAGALGRPVIDNYWQTESGWPILTVANGIVPQTSKFGSPGLPMPGYDVRLIDAETGADLTGANEKGVLAIEAPLPPGCLQTLWRDDQRFVDTYWRSIPGRLVYNTFDFALRDADGYFFMLGRTDDVINVAGHRLGTREIEESIAGHPLVAEVAVVGVADALKGQVAVAFVVLKDAGLAAEPADALRHEGALMKHVDSQLGAVARPARVRFVQALPKTRSGKLLRRALQALCEGRDPGDLTTLEDPSTLLQLKSLLASEQARVKARVNRDVKTCGPRLPSFDSSHPRGVGMQQWKLGRLVSALVVASACAAALAPSAALAEGKPRIEKAADLPRFTYKIDGKLEDLVRSPERFTPFAAAVRRDTESVLGGYDIPDKATRRDLLGLLATLDFLDGQYDRAMARAEEVRALQDKPADKLISGLRLRAMSVAATKAGNVQTAAYAGAVADELKRLLEPLPYPVIENDIKSAKAGAELIGEALVLGRVREVMQPIVDKNGTLSSDFAPGIVGARFALTSVLPLKSTLAKTYGDYLAAHTTVKPDIWAARDVTLTPEQVKAPVVLAVWDSGVDTGLFAQQLVMDGDKPAVIAFDKYSRPSSGALQPIGAVLEAKLPEMKARTKGFSDLQSNIDSKEASEVKTFLSTLAPADYKAAIEEIGLAGNYEHGTHVAGIAMAGNPGARLLVARIEFGHTLKPDPCPSRELSERDAKATQAYVDFLKQHKARVVNMSWGGNVGAVESDLEQCGIGKTPEDRKALARELFDMSKQALTQAFASAPDILFVTAAGNSNSDASFTEDVPAGIVLPNLLTVGAVDRAGDEAPFTSYGPTVKVHANGYQVESYLPGGDRVALSGTSMASPQVANLAAKMLAVNPKLTPRQLIDIITSTAERTPDGRRNLLDPKKALAAARGRG